MPFINNVKDLLSIVKSIPKAETAKLAIVRPTTHFEIVTADNPDMVRTLEEQKKYVSDKLNKIEKQLSNKEREEHVQTFEREFQKTLSKKAHQEQLALFEALKQNGIAIMEILEDKVDLKKVGYYYFTDQIFATDTGQYFDKNGQLCFIPGDFKNDQRKGEERLAIAQGNNIGATVMPLMSDNDSESKLIFKSIKPNMSYNEYKSIFEKLVKSVTTPSSKLTFEGGDIRQMVGRKLFFIGQGHRSDPKTSPAISKATDYYVLPIKLIQPQFYHLDCCFLPLPNDAAVIYEGEYKLNDQNEKIYDANGWPVIVEGTETMAPESRALIRNLYQADKLILINKQEALAFATNAALLQSMRDNRFKLFVNGEEKCLNQDENSALSLHQKSFTTSNIQKMLKVTEKKMDIVQVPYNTMHNSGGSIRCSIQEVACTQTALKPQRKNKRHFSETMESLENNLALSRRRF